MKRQAFSVNFSKIVEGCVLFFRKKRMAIDNPSLPLHVGYVGLRMLFV